MQPKIERIANKKLIGKRLRMSLAGDRTRELWQSFMPDRHKIKGTVSTNLFSMQIYDESFNFEVFDFEAQFDKMAATEVTDFAAIPAGMEAFTLDEGLYAVFIHKGAGTEGARTFRYIFGTWLPGSDYIIDNRPHFEILGPKYTNDDPNSEEEIWIPIKPKIKP
jgi:AraC family transcriptional regulator